MEARDLYKSVAYDDNDLRSSRRTSRRAESWDIAPVNIKTLKPNLEASPVLSEGEGSLGKIIRIPRESESSRSRQLEQSACFGQVGSIDEDMKNTVKMDTGYISKIVKEGNPVDHNDRNSISTMNNEFTLTELNMKNNNEPFISKKDQENDYPINEIRNNDILNISGGQFESTCKKINYKDDKENTMHSFMSKLKNEASNIKDYNKKVNSKINSRKSSIFGSKKGSSKCCNNQSIKKHLLRENNHQAKK